MKLANNFFFYLLCLLPLIFITGPFLTDLSISIIALYFLIILIKKKFIFLFKNYFFLLFALFCIYLWITGLLSNNPIESLFSNDAAFFYFRYLLFAFGGAYLINKNKVKINHLKFILLITFSIVLIDTYIQFIIGKNLLGYVKYEGNRLTSFFKDETIVCQFLVKMFSVIFALNFINKKSLILKEEIILILFLFSTFFITLVSGERLSFFLIFSFLIGLSIYPSIYQKYFLYFLLISVLIFIFTYFGNDYLNFRVNQTFNQIQANSTGFMPYTIDHEKHYISAFKIFLNNPVLGYGPSSFEYACNEEIFFVKGGCGSHPHNFYLQLLAETGLIGFSFLLFFFFFILLNILKLFDVSKKDGLKNISKFSIFLIILLILIPIMPSNNFYNNHLNFLNFFPICFFIYFKYFKDEKKLNF